MNKVEMNKLKVKGADILEMQLHTIKEAEEMLRNAEVFEGLSFLMKGKAFKFIRDGIDAGLPEFKKYNSFHEYCNLPENSSTKYNKAISLVVEFEYIEELRVSGTPIDELPKSLWESEVQRTGKESSYNRKKAEIAVLKSQKKDIVDEIYSTEEGADIHRELIHEEQEQREKIAVEDRNKHLTEKPALAIASNDFTLADQVELASKRAKDLNEQLLLIVKAAKGLGEEGQEFEATTRQLNWSLKNFAELNQTLNKILNNQ